MSDIYFEQRKEKLTNWKQRQIVYPGKFKKMHKLAQVKSLDDGTAEVSVAGRLVSLRVMGKSLLTSS